MLAFGKNAVGILRNAKWLYDLDHHHIPYILIKNRITKWNFNECLQPTKRSWTKIAVVIYVYNINFNKVKRGFTSSKISTQSIIECEVIGLNAFDFKALTIMSECLGNAELNPFTIKKTTHCFYFVYIIETRS